MNICIIGKDNRMDCVAEYFFSLGYDVGRDISNIAENTILILPPPVKESIFYDLKNNTNSLKRIYGGSISDPFINLCKENNIEVYDYLKWEDVISENAYLTAKGIIKEAMQCNANFSDSNCIVTGYGFCGKAIASALSDLKAKVCIAARNPKLKCEIIESGYDFIDIKSMSNLDISYFDYLFNTVPADVINRNVIDNLNSKSMIFDIASGVGGVDFHYCKEKNIFFIHSLGIPGRMYPIEAGYLIAKACFNPINSI